MFRNFLIGLGSLAIVLGLAYFLLDRSADERLREGLAQAAADLPPGATLTYDRANANFLTNGARIDGLQIEVIDESGRRTEFDSARIDIEGYSGADGGVVEDGDITEVLVSFSLPDGRQVEVTAARVTIAEIALAPLNALLVALRDGQEMDAETLRAMKIRAFTVERAVMTAPGAGGEVNSLWLQGMEDGLIAAVGLQDLKATFRETPPQGDAAATDDDSEAGKIDLRIGGFSSQNLSYVALNKRAGEGASFLLHDLAGPLAPQTRVKDVAVTTKGLRVHYAELIANYGTAEGKETAVGSLEDLTLTPLDSKDHTLADLKELGYEQPSFSSRWNVTLDAADGRVHIAPFTFTLRDGGDLNLQMTLQPPEGVKTLLDLSALDDYEGFGIDALSLELLNDGLFQRMLQRKAAEEGRSPEALTEELAAKIEAQLADQPGIAGPLTAFVRDPRRLALSIVLPKTLPMETLFLALAIQPQAIAENAEVTVSAN